MNFRSGSGTSFFATNAKNVTRNVLITGEEVKMKYKELKSKYIAFVKEYNAAKLNGAVSLNEEEQMALSKLQEKWKNASPKQDMDYFCDMKEHYDYLNAKFLNPKESSVHAAWSEYKEESTRFGSSLMAYNMTAFTIMPEPESP